MLHGENAESDQIALQRTLVTGVSSVHVLCKTQSKVLLHTILHTKSKMLLKHMQRSTGIFFPSKIINI